MGRSRAHPREGGSAEPRTLGPVTDRLGRLLLVTLEAARVLSRPAKIGCPLLIVR